MPKADKTLTVHIEDRASATLRGLIDLPPRGREIDVPPLPTDLIHITAAPQPDGSMVIVQRPSVAVLKWATKVASECWPRHLRSVKVVLPND